MSELSSDEIRTKLAELSHKLSKAQEDAALYDRLKKAAAEVTRIQKLGNDLTAKLAKVLEEEDRAERDRFAATIRDVRVDTTYDQKLPGSFLHLIHTVNFERLSWNGRENVWAPHAIPLQNLEHPLLRYVLDRGKELLPAGILALGNGDPAAGYEQFLRARKRGYLTSKAA